MTKTNYSALQIRSFCGACFLLKYCRNYDLKVGSCSAYSPTFLDLSICLNQRISDSYKSSYIHGFLFFKGNISNKVCSCNYNYYIYIYIKAIHWTSPSKSWITIFESQGGMAQYKKVTIFFYLKDVNALPKFHCLAWFINRWGEMITTIYVRSKHQTLLFGLVYVTFYTHLQKLIHSGWKTIIKTKPKGSTYNAFGYNLSAINTIQ